MAITSPNGRVYQKCHGQGLAMTNHNFATFTSMTASPTWLSPSRIG